MKVLSLFSGIGGLDKGLEMAGMTIVAHSEIDPYCCEVLKKHWPDVPNLGDITKIDWNGVPPVDVICGGFPCTDVSVAGKQKGIKDDTRSGLWFYFRDAISVLRPRYAIIENVAGIFSSNHGRDFARVLSDLAEIGYDAEWACVSAASVGAHHKRERVFIVAYPRGRGCSESETGGKQQGRNEIVSSSEIPAHTQCNKYATLAIPHDSGRNPRGDTQEGCLQAEVGQAKATDEAGTRRKLGAGERSEPVAYPIRSGSNSGSDGTGRQTGSDFGGRCETPTMADAIRSRSSEQGESGQPLNPAQDSEGQADRSNHGCQHEIEHTGRIFSAIHRNPFWDDCDHIRGSDGTLRAVKPGVRLLADGVPKRVAKLKALGNAVVPQCAEYVGNAIMRSRSK